MRECEINHNLVRAVLVTSFFLAALVALLTAGTDTAFAHRFGYDSVDGREIRYEVHSRFEGEIRFGVNQWNRLGQISIRQAGSGADLEFRDYSRNDGNAGYYQFRSGIDRISFNVREMNRLDRFDKRGTAVHELGHALGLAHPGNAKHWCKDSVMYYTFCKGSPNTPQAHDKQDYRELWGSGRRAERQSADAGTATLEPLYAFDAKDKRKLVGYATNVFRGRVVEEAGTEGAPLSGPGEKVLPKTQFSVVVQDNVKGNLGGTVTVSQTGGYDEEGREVLVEDDSLLEPGREYLFSTSYDEEEDRYVIVAQPFGAVPIGDEEGRAEADESFEQAEAGQISPDSTNR